ncbi:Xaa-Pro aminopeptidase [Streptomyces sp. TE3672]
MARIDVRIEGDLVVTEDGHENLSADKVAAWTARFAG